MWSLQLCIVWIMSPVKYILKHLLIRWIHSFLFKLSDHLKLVQWRIQVALFWFTHPEIHEACGNEISSVHHSGHVILQVFMVSVQICFKTFKMCSLVFKRDRWLNCSLSRIYSSPTGPISSMILKKKKHIC